MNYFLEFFNENEVQGAIRWTKCELQPVSPSSLVFKKRRRELGSSGDVQSRAAD